MAHETMLPGPKTYEQMIKVDVYALDIILYQLKYPILRHEDMTQLINEYRGDNISNFLYCFSTAKEEILSMMSCRPEDRSSLDSIHGFFNRL